MHKNTLIFVIIAAIGGFIGGFLLANTLNRSEMTSLRTKGDLVPATNSSSNASTGEPALSDAELRSKIAEADKNPTNFAFQKDLGTALYRYAAMKQDTSLLTESVRILERAAGLKPNDFDVLVALGNAHFDIGFANKDNVSYQTARDIYAKALSIKPDDPDVQTDLGITYFLETPPEYDKAVATLQKVADTNPKHTRSLQFLAQTFVKQGKLQEADKAIAKIRAIDPGNSAIPELSLQITAAKNGISQ